MFDAAARRALAPVTERAGAFLARAGVSAAALTGTGFAAGIGACLAAATGHWQVALGLWLANRLCDGLDGPVARVRGATDFGGFLDIVADFAIYSGFILAVAIAVPSARLACAALLVAYYVSGTAFLALSSLLERRSPLRRTGHQRDGRSLRFVGGLAEGGETIVAYVLICLFPHDAGVIVWAFTAAVAVTAGYRIAIAATLLRPEQCRLEDGEPAPAAGTPRSAHPNARLTAYLSAYIGTFSAMKGGAKG